MRKLFALLLLSATPMFAQFTTLSPTGMKVPVRGSNNWDIPLYYNWALINNMLGGVSPLPNGLQVNGPVSMPGFILTPSQITNGLGFNPLNPANNLSDVTNPAISLQNLGGIGINSYQGVWNNSTSYSKSALVNYNGDAYISLQSGNVGNQPDVSPTDWGVLMRSSGTVTSVAATVPSWLQVAGSPITSSGTLAITASNQSANTVLAGPSSGSAAVPGFRALVPADVPPTSFGVSGLLYGNGSSAPSAATITQLGGALFDAGENSLISNTPPLAGWPLATSITGDQIWGYQAGQNLGNGPAITVAATASSGSTTLNVTNTVGLQQYMAVSGAGIAANTVLNGIGGAPVTLSNALTGSPGTVTITQSATATASSGSTQLTVTSSAGIYPGMTPSGTGIGGNNMVLGVTGNVVTLQWATIAAVSGTVVFSATENSTGTSGSTTLILSAAGWMPVVGMAVSGGGIPAATTITAVQPISLTLSAATTAAVSGSVTFNYGATQGFICAGYQCGQNAYSMNGTVALGWQALQNCNGQDGGNTDGESVNGIYIGPFAANADRCISIAGSALIGDFEPVVIGNKSMVYAQGLQETVAIGNHGYGVGDDKGSTFVGGSILSASTWGPNSDSLVSTTNNVVVGANQLNGAPPANNTGYSMINNILIDPLGVTCFFNSEGNVVIGAQIAAMSSCTGSSLFSGGDNIFIGSATGDTWLALNWTGGSGNIVMTGKGYGGSNPRGGNLSTGNGNTILGAGAGVSVLANNFTLIEGNNSDCTGSNCVALGAGALAAANNVEINAGATSYTNSVQNTAQFWNWNLLDTSGNVNVKLLVASHGASAIASAATIAPSFYITHISGTAAISTITPPTVTTNGGAFSGCLQLIPDGAFTLATGGNIGKASTAVVDQLMTVCYDGTMWYPSY